ncbi:hypothetical protein EAG_11959 [Camponotus floridanus]|uniref:Uncharacterized protein n=1 Tax=Camponotus floridanus TaxID=104421 RepID=E2AW82_CAMFO|nr:hypothetical protein EAG_11959 [Camponotus floridanus]
MGRGEREGGRKSSQGRPTYVTKEYNAKKRGKSGWTNNSVHLEYLRYFSRYKNVVLIKVVRYQESPYLESFPKHKDLFENGLLSGNDVTDPRENPRGSPCTAPWIASRLPRNSALDPISGTRAIPFLPPLPERLQQQRSQTTILRVYMSACANPLDLEVTPGIQRDAMTVRDQEARGIRKVRWSGYAKGGGKWLSSYLGANQNCNPNILRSSDATRNVRCSEEESGDTIHRKLASCIPTLDASHFPYRLLQSDFDFVETPSHPDIKYKINTKDKTSTKDVDTHKTLLNLSGTPYIQSIITFAGKRPAKEPCCTLEFYDLHLAYCFSLFFFPSPLFCSESAILALKDPECRSRGVEARRL